MASMNAFQYEPLDPNPEKLMLRRLELLPGTGQIECKLESVSLNDKPVYEAISYHWGSTAKKHQIVCNSASLAITDSLHSALVRFRKADESRYLWADQLCINQSDADERGCQVAFMREIYENALQTLIWLGGREDDDPDAAFGLLRRLATTQRRRKACTPPDKRTIYELSHEEVAEYGLPEATDKIWGTFQYIFLRPWFSRLWVIQEVNVSKSAAIYCHNSEISAADFMAGVDCANDLGPMWLMGNVTYDNPFRVLGNQSQDIERPSLISLLIGFSYFQATDPRDKVYGLIGLAPAHERANIVPDYNLSAEQVFLSTTIAILEQSGNLDILCSVAKRPAQEAETQVSGLPTWVCNYANGDPHTLLPEYNFLRSQRNIKAPKFCAGGNLPSQPTFSTDRRELILRGFVLDSIDTITPAHIRPGFTNAKSKLSIRKTAEEGASAFQAWEHSKLLVKSDGPKYRNGEDIDDVMWQLVSGGCAPEEFEVAQGEYQRVSNEHLCSIFRARASLVGRTRHVPGSLPALPLLMKHGTNMLQWFVHAHYSVRILRRYQLFRSHTMCLLWAWFLIVRIALLDKLKINRPLELSFLNRLASEDKRGIKTSNRWLGLAPQECRVGDVVALFRGGRMPLVLRSNGAGKWKLVGAAYVHGVMYGEAFEEDKCESMCLV